MGGSCGMINKDRINKGRGDMPFGPEVITDFEDTLLNERNTAMFLKVEYIVDAAANVVRKVDAILHQSLDESFGENDRRKMAKDSMIVWVAYLRRVQEKATQETLKKLTANLHFQHSFSVLAAIHASLTLE